MVSPVFPDIVVCMKTLIAVLLAAVSLTATEPTKNQTVQADHIAVIYVPLTDAGLCALGAAMPGCVTDGPVTAWVKMVVIENAAGAILSVISQTMVSSK